MTENSSRHLPFSYEDYSEWFDVYAEDYLMPALAEARRALDELLDQELPEQQRVRVRVDPGRTKTKARTWKKLNDKYIDKVQGLADIPVIVDDLVGLRIICNNRSDVDRVVDVLDGIQEFEDGDDPVLATHSDTVKDWRLEPKPSGYRAYHLNLCTSVSHVTERHVVICELQIRTLLQESWGELTHEDTYKPGANVPQLVSMLSKRMADLMATLDDIAEDLRLELDRLAESSLTESSGKVEKQAKSPDREAAADYLSARISELKRPTPLAPLAWELQREFGREIADGWFGYGTFKNLLKEAIRDVQVSTTPPAYVLPAGFDASSYPDIRMDAPRGASLLNDIDPAFPLVDSPDWPHVYQALAEATGRVAWEPPPDARTVNELARDARDGSGNGHKHVTRNQVRYVAKGLLHGRELSSNMSKNEVEDKFIELTVPRVASLGLPQAECRELDKWLRGKFKPRGARR